MRLDVRDFDRSWLQVVMHFPVLRDWLLFIRRRRDGNVDSRRLISADLSSVWIVQDERSNAS